MKIAVDGMEQPGLFADNGKKTVWTRVAVPLRTPVAVSNVMPSGNGPGVLNTTGSDRPGTWKVTEYGRPRIAGATFCGEMIADGGHAGCCENVTAGLAISPTTVATMAMKSADEGAFRRFAKDRIQPECTAICRQTAEYLTLFQIP